MDAARDGPFGAIGCRSNIEYGDRLAPLQHGPELLHRHVNLVGGNARIRFHRFSAVNSTAFTPYSSAASRVDGFRKVKPGTIVDRMRWNPVSSSNLNTSPSGRAPPIQLAHSLGSLTMLCASCVALTMSVMEIRPFGLRTRKSCSMTRRLRKE